MIRPMIRPMVRPLTSAVTEGVGGGFSPLSLFSGGVQGAWYDPSDLSTLFSDSAGTTAAVVDGPVGKMLDKSGNGNHATQATTASKPILRNSGGLYWLEFDGVDDFLSVPSSTALFNYMHNGLGGAAFVGAHFGTVADPNALYGVLGNNNFVFGSGAGFNVAWDDRAASSKNNQLNAQVSPSVFATSTANGAVSANAPVVVGVTHILDAGATDLTLYANLTSVATGDSATARSTANATTNLEIGRVSASFPLNGKVFGAIIVANVPTETRRTSIIRSLGTKAGLTL